MDRIIKIKIVTAIVCYGMFFFGYVGLSSVFAGDAPSNAVTEEEAQLQEAQQEGNVGIIDFIGNTGITINDQGYDLPSGIHYRTAGGGVAGKNHFKVGDVVEFEFDSQEMAITELRMKSRGEQEKNLTEKKKSDGIPKLENGVWTN